MTPPDQPELDALDEDLVAYLDGELDAESARRIENLLSTDDSARRKLRQLAGSWDLLDQLPRQALGESFMRTTVAMIAVATSQDLAIEQTALPSRKRRRWIAALVAAIAAASVGFAAVVVWWPDRNEPLLRDLPVIENFDAYRHGGNLAFLHQLDKSALFFENGPEGSASQSPAPPQAAAAYANISARRERVLSLAPDAKTDLRKQLEKFAALPEEDKQKLRDFDEQLRADPNHARLRNVLQQYSDWLGALNALERHDLLQLPPDQRLSRIRELRDRDIGRLARQFAGRGQKLLPESDIREIMSWLERIAFRDKAAILKDAAPHEVDEVNSRPMEQQGHALGFILAKRSGGGPPQLPPSIDSKDFELLEESDKLSREARDILKKQPDLEQKRKQISEWIFAFFRAQFASRFEVSRETLHNFFLNDLSDEERNELNVLPPDEFRLMLRRLYFQKKRFGGHHGPGGPPDFRGPPGDGPPFSGENDKRGKKQFGKGGPGGDGPRGKWGRPEEDRPRQPPDKEGRDRPDRPLRRNQPRSGEPTA